LPGQLFSLPHEAIYNEVDAVAYFQKCSERGNPSIMEPDLECLEPPYDKVMRFAIVATLKGNPTGQVNAQVHFDFHITDPCIYDTVSFTSNTSQLEYILNPSAYPSEKTFSLESTYPLCPKSCYLTD